VARKVDLQKGNATMTLSAESSAEIRDRVVRARRVQLERFAGERMFCNAQVSPQLIRKYCVIDSASKSLLENDITRLGLSASPRSHIESEPHSS
jgi:magnesium chelatase family protein